MSEFWNERFNRDEFVYGTEPNSFFRKELGKLTAGKLLLPGEGEGRNAIYAAKQGWDVHAFDTSEIARQKAVALAEKGGVNINYSVEDITTFSPQSNHYDAAAVIYVHLPEEGRVAFHHKLIDALKPGGTLILEVFEKEQIKNNSGGPKNEAMLYSLEEIYTDFHPLDITSFAKETIKLSEGAHHKGTAEVIRYVGIKR